MGELEEALGSQVQICVSWSIVSIWEVIQQMENFFLSLLSVTAYLKKKKVYIFMNFVVLHQKIVGGHLV